MMKDDNRKQKHNKILHGSWKGRQGKVDFVRKLNRNSTELKSDC